MARHISGRVRKTPQTGLTSDRYDFLNLESAEPDLGDPIVGPSSIQGKPFPLSGNVYVVASYDTEEPGNRFWIPGSQLAGAGLIPGSYTIFNNDIPVGAANSFNKFNFVGTGVTVDPVAYDIESQTGIATVRITVTDLLAPGSLYNIPYHGDSGLLDGGSAFYYNPNSDSVGIGSFSPQQKLDVEGNARISDTLYVENIEATNVTFDGDVNLSLAQTVTATRIDVNRLFAHQGFVTTAYIENAYISAGIGTFNFLDVTDSDFEHFHADTVDIASGIGTFDRVGVTTLIVDDAYINGGIGTFHSITTPNFEVGAGGTFVIATDDGKVGIGSTLPTTSLDVIGNVKITGYIALEEGTGSPGQILISQGTSPAIWGDITDTTVGSATSVSINEENSDDSLHYLTFTKTTNTIGGIFADSADLVYNPVQNRLGIGTTSPEYEIDVIGDGRVSGLLYVQELIATGSSQEQVIRESSGIITTSSLQTVLIDNIDPTLYRSAKYVVQISTTGTLFAESQSVQSITGGTGYIAGTYLDVPLVSSTGLGSDAHADLRVIPEYTLELLDNTSGIFTIDTTPARVGISTTTTSGITTGQTVYFNSIFFITDAENSTVAFSSVTNPGTGYLSIPNIIVDSPIIAGNPVPGVGVGSTAALSVNSLIVTNVDIYQPITTTTISPLPTVVIDPPSGVGTAAGGLVGVGVSTIELTNVGTGYSVSPTITISELTDFQALVGLGISDFGIEFTGGENYTSPPTITVVAVGGIGTDAVIEVDINPDAPNNLQNVTITNVGSGYTTIPEVLVQGGGGTGAGITITSMVANSVDIISPGYGSTVPLTTGEILIEAENFIGNGLQVSVTSIFTSNILISNTGSGYTSADLPVPIGFSGITGLGASVYMGIESVNIDSRGIGYQFVPTVTVDSPEWGSDVATVDVVVGYNDVDANVKAGPGFGGTTVYFINPISETEFRITNSYLGVGRTMDTEYETYTGHTIPVGFASAFIGGKVTEVLVTDTFFGGSGYATGDTVTAVDFDQEFNPFSGIGFTFAVGDTTNNFQVSDLLILHTAEKDSHAYVVEQAGISDQIGLGEASADVLGGNVRLLFTPTFSYSEIKFFKTLFTL